MRINNLFNAIGIMTVIILMPMHLTPNPFSGIFPGQVTDGQKI